MKQFFGLFLIILLGQEIRASSSTLRSEVEEILEHIEAQKIIEISREYFENDMTVQVLLRYLQSEKFLSSLRQFMSVSEIKDILEWMKSNKVDLEYEIEQLIKSIWEISPNRIRRNVRFQSFSMESFGNEIIELINFDEIDETVDRLLRNGNDLAHLYLILMINRSTIEEVFDTDEVAQIMHDLQRFGINTDSAKEHIYRLFRWT